jgi:hypothetical protein
VARTVKPAEPKPPSGLFARSTPDLVMLGLTLLVIILLVGGLIGIWILAVWGDGSVDLNKLITNLGSTTSSLIAAVVGYAAGRGMSGHPGGPGDTPPTPPMTPNE